MSLNWGDPKKHGGNLEDARNYFSSPAGEWLDLSAALNPNAYPVCLDSQSFQYLPGSLSALEVAACANYEASHALAVAGSQWAIEQLPRLRAKCRVAIPVMGYREHALHWQREGHSLWFYQDISQLTQWVQNKEVDVAVVINPNNPTGERYQTSQLLNLHQQLQDNKGWLIVDEAFADLYPHLSLARESHRSGLIVLRSFGKFYGLPGLRLGFVLSDVELRSQLAEYLGPWPVNSAAQRVGLQALEDKCWQREAQRLLLEQSERLSQLLNKSFGKSEVINAGLFCSVGFPPQQARDIHRQMAERGVWLRLVEGENTSLLRFGLPGNELDWQRLAKTLSFVLK